MKQDSRGAIADSEVSDVLFHFDTIVTELEKSTLTPRSVTPIDPLARTPTPNQGRTPTPNRGGTPTSNRGRTPTPTPNRGRDVVSPDILTQATSTRQDREGGGGGKGGEGSEVPKEVPPKSVQPKFKVEDIKLLFLQNAQRDTSPCPSPRPPHSEMTPCNREKVKSIIAQMQASTSSQETSPSPTPEREGRDTSPAKQTRQRSSSISQRISMLTQMSATESEVFEKKEQPVTPSRSISEMAHNFELKKQPPQQQPAKEGSKNKGGKNKAAPGRQRRRSSSASKASSKGGDDLLKIHSPPKLSKRLGASHENGLPPSVRTARDVPSGVMVTYTSQEIEEGLGEIIGQLSSSEPHQDVAGGTGEGSSGSSAQTVALAEDNSSQKVGGSNLSTELCPTPKDPCVSEIEPSEVSSTAVVATSPSTLQVENEHTQTFMTVRQVEPLPVSEGARDKDDVIAIASSSEFIPTFQPEPVSLTANTTSKERKTSSCDDENRKTPASVSSPVSEGVVFRNESTSSGDGLLNPVVAGEEHYRFRSISDVLTSYRTEGSLSSGRLAHCV